MPTLNESQKALNAFTNLTPPQLSAFGTTSVTPEQFAFKGNGGAFDVFGNLAAQYDFNRAKKEADINKAAYSDAVAQYQQAKEGAALDLAAQNRQEDLALAAEKVKVQQEQFGETLGLRKDTLKGKKQERDASTKAAAALLKDKRAEADRVRGLKQQDRIELANIKRANQAAVKDNEASRLTPKQILDLSQQSSNVLSFGKSAKAFDESLAKGKDTLTTVGSSKGLAQLLTQEVTEGRKTLSHYFKGDAGSVETAIDNAVLASNNPKLATDEGKAKAKALILSWASAQGQSLAKLSDKDMGLITDAILGSWGSTPNVRAAIHRAAKTIFDKHSSTLQNNTALFGKGAKTLNQQFGKGVSPELRKWLEGSSDKVTQETTAPVRKRYNLTTGKFEVVK